MKRFTRPKLLSIALGLALGLFGAGPACAQTVTIGDATTTEGNLGTKTLTFTVTATNNGAAQTPGFTLRADTELVASEAETDAVPGGNDFVPLINQLLSFPALDPGQSSQQTVSVTLVGDILFEDDETFFVDLDVVTGTPTLTDETAVGTIVNDEAVPTLTINNVTVCEDDGVAVFLLTLSNPTELTSQVSFATQNGTAIAGQDYSAVTGTTTFGPFDTSETISVPILDDGLLEPNETFSVQLTLPANANLVLGGATAGLGTIADNDGVNTVTVVDVSGGVAGVVGEQQCFLITARNGCGDPVPNAEVAVNLTSDTGNLVTEDLITNEAGQATFCFTPLFPGEFSLNVTSGLGGGAFSGVVDLVDGSTRGVTATGNGFVQGFSTLDAGGGRAGQFNFGVSVARNGRPKGSVNFVQGGTRLISVTGRRTVGIHFRSVRLTAVQVFEPATGGQRLVIFGVGRFDRIPGLFPFRVDALDVSRPGVPGDRFELRVLTAAGVLNLTPEPGTEDIALAGGALLFPDSPGLRRNNDVKIRRGF